MELTHTGCAMNIREGQDEEKINSVDQWFIDAVAKLKLALRESPNNPVAMVRSQPYHVDVEWRFLK